MLRLPAGRRLLAAPLLVLLSLLLAAPAHAIDTSFLAPQPRPFAPASVWNAPLWSTAKIAPNSASLSAQLKASVATYGDWINSTQYSTPVYTVPASQPLVKVTLDRYNATLAASWARVPLPPTAVPARGTDAHLVLVQPSTGMMWEFFKLRKATDGWHAAWGATAPSLATHPGNFPGTNFGATASGIALLAGLPRLWELEQGRIYHALTIAIPHTRKGVVTSPAVRTDGSTDSTTAIPMGTRFRIDPKLDLSTLGLSKIGWMLADAAQRYGMVVRDTTSSTVAFEVEDPTPAGFTINERYNGGRTTNQALDRFPWDRLQVIAP